LFQYLLAWNLYLSEQLLSNLVRDKGVQKLMSVLLTL